MPKQPLKPHGTYAAYVRHHRRGEDPCELCRNYSIHDREWAERYRTRGRARSRARSRALSRLASIYAELFGALYAEELNREGLL